MQINELKRDHAISKAFLKTKSNWVALKNILFFLLIFILFHKWVNALLSTFLVNPILSYVSPSSVSFDIATILLALTCIIKTYIKINRGVKIPTKWLLISFLYFIIYLFYRFSNSPFQFTSFSFYNNFKLLDLISVTPLIICVISINTALRLKKELETSDLGFDIDEPVKISVDSDELNRIKFLNKIAEMIFNTESKSGSFPIGIVAPWGSGKTTFLNSLREKLINKIITIEIDLWRCNSTDQIIETFFTLLKQKLKTFSFTIDNRINEYSKSLIKDSNNPFIKNFPTLLFSNKNVEEQYSKLKEEIEIIDKKIVVIIDDLDRLNKKEIYEVIRLIRNTANFANIFFLVAYDRNYILNAIEEINPYNSHTFLEKVFQVEINLPPIEIKILRDAVTKRIEQILSKRNKISYEDFQKEGLSFEFNRTNLTQYYVQNMRDVTRFVNLFKLNYSFVKDEIYLQDFYNLQLIRFKHPEIFIEFFRQKSKFLKAGTRKDYFPQKPFTYALALKNSSGDEKNSVVSYLELYLKTQKPVYKINDEDIEAIKTSFSNIFQPHNNINLNGTDSSLSVVRPSMFDRYFLLGIEGRLSSLEFSKARQLDTDLFIEQIVKWAREISFREELIEKFDDIVDFDDRKDFEKVISAIFSLGEIVNFQLHFLEIKLSNNENKLADLFYNGDKDVLKRFVLSLFQNTKSPFHFVSRFARHLDSRYYEEESFLIPKEKLNALSIKYLKTYCKKTPKLDENVWSLFWDCEITTFVDSRSTKQIPIQAKTIIRAFILKKDFGEYLLSHIEIEPFSKKTYTIRSSISNVFDDWILFEKILKKQSEQKWKYLKEFKRFFEAVKANNFSKYIEFDFKEIKLRDR